MTTIREELKVIRKDILENIEALSPDALTIHICRLAVYMGNVSEANAQNEREYHARWCALKVSAEKMTDGHTDHLAKNTDAYYLRRVSELELEAIAELINALKKRCAVLGLEQSGARNMEQ